MQMEQSKKKGNDKNMASLIYMRTIILKHEMVIPEGATHYIGSLLESHCFYRIAEGHVLRWSKRYSRWESIEDEDYDSSELNRITYADSLMRQIPGVSYL